MSQELTISEYINQPSIIQNIQDTLKDRSDQFVTSLISLVKTDAKLANADRKSLLSACLVAASMDLPINQNLGFAFIIPYFDGKTKTTLAQFQMGYKGFVQLALRSNTFHRINVTDVKEGELLGEDKRTGELKFNWLPDGPERDGKKTVGFLAYFKLLNGFEKDLFMTTEELKKHGVRFSQTFKRGFGLWKDDFDAMAKKTVLKLLLSRFAPMTTQMAKAQEADQAVVNLDGQVDYPDNEPVDPTELSREKEVARIKKHIEDSKSVKELTECVEAVQQSDDAELQQMYDVKFQQLEDVGNE